MTRFEKLAERARADRPPRVDVAASVVARLGGGLTREPAGRRSHRGLIVTVLAVSSSAACVLGALGYQAFRAIEQMGSNWLDPLGFWVSL